MSCPPGTTALLPLHSQKLEDGLDPTLSAPAMNRGGAHQTHSDFGVATTPPTTTTFNVAKEIVLALLSISDFTYTQKKHMTNVADGTLSNSACSAFQYVGVWVGKTW